MTDPTESPKMEIQGFPVHSNQMSLAFEKQALVAANVDDPVMSCTLVTGFLGSGKTTLCQHVLRERGDVQVAMLVNEFAELDVDSLLLDTNHSNAAMGITSLQLSNGCACCSVRGGLRDAIRSILRGPHRFRHLVIETSGVADPQPIALVLSDLGVVLHRVVTVVDVEALPEILNSPVAKRQLAFADLILINKCDLVSLGQVSDVEDLVEAAVEGATRAVRTRFCRVPLGLVLDLPPVAPPPSLSATTANATEGVLSHESSSGRPLHHAGAGSAGMANKAELAARGEATARVAEVAGSGPDGNFHEADGFVSLVFSSDRPLQLAAFQAFVVGPLQLAGSVLRVKGLIWLQERRKLRYVFQSSGKQRCEAICGSQWESPPACHLAFIGRSRSQLEALLAQLRNCTVAAALSTKGQDLAVSAATAFAKLLACDDRFTLHTLVRDEGERHVVFFGLKGAPLLGLHEAHLNWALMQEVNSRKNVFVSSAVPASNPSGFLQLAFDGSSAEAAWADVAASATKVLAKARRQMCPCRCDISADMVSNRRS